MMPNTLFPTPKTPKKKTKTQSNPQRNTKRGDAYFTTIGSYKPSMESKTAKPIQIDKPKALTFGDCKCGSALNAFKKCTSPSCGTRRAA